MSSQDTLTECTAKFVYVLVSWSCCRLLHFDYVRPLVTWVCVSLKRSKIGCLSCVCLTLVRCTLLVLLLILAHQYISACTMYQVLLSLTAWSLPIQQCRCRYLCSSSVYCSALFHHSRPRYIAVWSRSQSPSNSHWGDSTVFASACCQEWDSKR